MTIKHKLWLLWIKLTHSILCKLRWHRLVTWNNDIEGGDKQCWCCEKVGGGWIKPIASDKRKECSAKRALSLRMASRHVIYHIIDNLIIVFH